MKSFLLSLFLFAATIGATAQERSVELPKRILSLSEVCHLFSKDHNITFSFDADKLDSILFDGRDSLMSLSNFKNTLLSDYSIDMNEVSPNDFQLIFDSSEIHFCGVVVDDLGLPILDAYVLKGDRMVAQTDSLGQFVVNFQVNTYLKIYASGMFEKQVRVRKLIKDCLPIELAIKVTQLQEVIVQDYLTLGTVKNDDSSIKISPNALGLLPGFVEPDIFQSLQRIPGVNSPTEDPTNLFIRGGTPDQNLILYDGIKMYLNDHFFKQISSYNPYIVKDVNVYRGGTSVRYGERISGVVDIKSADDVFDKLKVGGGINLTSADAYLKIPVSDKLGILLAGRRSLTDLYRTFTYNTLAEKVFQNSRIAADESQTSNVNANPPVNYFFSDVNFKTVWKPSAGHRLQFSLINISNELKTTNSISENDTSFETGDMLTEKNLGLGFSWVNNRQGKTKKVFEAYFSSYTSDYTFNSDLNSETVKILGSFSRGNGIKDLGYDLYFDIPLSEKQSLLIGQQSAVKGIDIKSFEAIDNSQLNAPFNRDFFSYSELLDLIGYSEYKYKSDKLYFSFGLRAGLYNNYSDILLEPRLYTSKKVSDKVRLTASAEIKNQSFGQFYLPQEGSNSATTLQVANSLWGTQSLNGVDIAILRSKQLTIGGLYDFHGWLIELEGYYKAISNALPYDDNLVPNLFQIQERTTLRTGTGNRIGLDFLLKKKYRDYRIWLSYAFGINTNKFADVQAATFKDSYAQTHNINISQTYNYKNFEFGLGFSASSGLPFTDIGQGTEPQLNTLVFRNEINRDQLPTYFRWDSSVLYKFQMGEIFNGRIGFAMRNITNRRVPIKLDYSLTSATTENTVIQANERNSLGFIGDFVFRINF